MNKDELKAIYFSFFDQLKPEHAEKAKANYDEDWVETEEPGDHADAIIDGFLWDNSPEENPYWYPIYKDLRAESYPLQLTPQKITVEVKEFTTPELTEESCGEAARKTMYGLPKRMATDEDYEKLDEIAPESICQEAQRIQGGDRQQDYGSPTKNFQDIADLWSTYIKTSLDVDVDLKARDVAHMSILMKISRNVHKPKRDNWVDMAGYAQCGGKVDEL